ncbi:MAG: universal stress protein [Planctomycetes bacterium]|nr:universal stress protein [Planctomycetota bacterium]
MIKKILIPLDGSKLSESIIPHAISLVEEDAHVYIIRVLSREDETCEITPSLRSLYNGTPKMLKTSIAIKTGDPVQVILSEANKLEIDAILLTTHGNTGLFSISLGSVAQKITHTCKKPLLLLKPGKKLNNGYSYKSVVVPLDGSTISESAVNTAATFAKWWNSSITLIRVGPKPYWNHTNGHPEQSLQEYEIHHYMKRHVGNVNRLGLEGKYIYDRGDPVDRLWRVAVKANADIVISGSKRDQINHWIMGSFVESFIRNTSIPILLL